MMRAVIYARFSSDLQSDASIEDQVRICRDRAAREGWQVSSVFADYAVSGAIAARPQFQQLLTDARAGRFDIVLAEALDRISRDQEHIAGFYKQLTFAGVRVITIVEGEISELHVGLKGTMNALYLRDLAQKTHRGLEGRVRGGRSGGGLSYGYRVAPRTHQDGTSAAGELEIIQDEAETIRRIFSAYVGGQSPRAIGKALNAAGVPGPRGGRWTASLILGNAVRETGILRNRLYAGERVWNRQHFIKDPMTGKRIAQPNPPDAWITCAVPGLRIVEDPVWRAAQDRLAAGRRVLASEDPASSISQNHAVNAGAPLAALRRPRWLLSGLVRCGVCGGPMSVTGSDGRLGCANRHERGTCSNNRSVRRDRLVTRVLVGLKDRLLAPELVEEFVRSFVDEINAANRARGTRQAKLNRDHAKVGRQIRTLLELIKDGHGSAAMVQELRALEQQQEALAAEIAAAGVPEPVPALHPNLPELYRRKVEVLEAALRDPATAAAAAEALRDLIEAIVIFPGTRRGEVSVELRGDLAAFTRLDESGDAAGPAGNGRSGVRVGSLVAGAGFEPAAFRL